MAAIEVTAGSALADALQNAIQPKLVEMGWSTGGLDDSALSEYIVLMLVNGKTQDEIAADVTQDLLGLSGEDASAVAFSQWLFEQVMTLSGQSKGNGDAMATENENGVANGSTGALQDGTTAVDEDMKDDESNAATAQSGSAIPTGPKSMRTPKNTRMLGQLNKAMDRNPEAALHKIKAGASRINTHSRDPPKGPTPKGPRNHIARAVQVTQPTPRPLQNMPMAPQMTQMNPLAALTPEQQLQLMAAYEQQARLMAQLFPQQQNMFLGQMGAMPGAFPPAPQQAGKSLFERVDAPQGSNGSFNKRQYQNGHSALKPSVTSFEPSHSFNAEPASSMEVEPSSQPTTKSDPSTTICYFNLTCTKPDCHFVHQSPAAPPGTTIDMTDTCSFGAACKNRKCVGKHPSPSSLGPARSQEDCKFYPNCTNPVCPFRHPTTRPCRNGADCTVPNCTFSHSKIDCRYNPCLNPACPFKHVEGQKSGNFEDKVWMNKADEANAQEHVSDRKFVEDDLEEELIRPIEGGGVAEAHTDGIIT